MSAAAARGHRKSILIVDDEKLLLWSIREALRSEYRVWTAGSAEDALRLIPRIKHLDAALVDIRLPGASGYELIGELRKQHPTIKAFVMTAFDPESAPRQAFRARANGYLSKPFAMETLRNMLSSHLLSTPPTTHPYRTPA